MSGFSDLPVGKRLAIGFLSTSVLLAGIATLAVTSTNRLGDDVAKVDVTGNLAQDALKLKFGMADLNGWQTAYALDINLGTPGATDDTATSRKAFLASADSFQAALEQVRTYELDEQQAGLVEEITGDFEHFMQIDGEIIEAFRLGTPEGKATANQLVLVDEIKVFEEVSGNMSALADSAIESADTEVAAADDDASRTGMLITVGAIVAIVLGLVLARLIGRSITKPLNQLRDRLHDIAEGEGDLTARLAEDRKDELGAVAKSFNTFVGKVGDAIRTIAGHAMVIASSSEELSAVSKQLTGSAEQTNVLAQRSSATSNEVSESVQTVASATEEMTSVIGEIARSATEAANVAGKAMTLAERAQDAVTRLGSSSAQIDDVARLIGGIAEQTNLLALNATIEAARAGEAGKGFAVVATEVKDLATRSGGATADIARQVTLIQNDVAAAVEAIGEIVRVIDLINENQSTVAAAVQQQTATTDEISRSLVHVATGSGQITDDIVQVARTAEDASLGAHEASQAAVELSKLSLELQQLVGQFRT